MPSLFENLFGTSDKISNLPLFTKPQMQGLSDLVQQAAQMRQNQSSPYNLAQSRLQSLLSGGSDAYNAFAAPYMRQFQEQTIPGLAERFASLGGRGGALSSSGFGQSLGAAGAGLQDTLAAQAAGLQQNALSTALGDYYNTQNLGLTRAFEPTYQPGTTDLFGGLLSGIGGGLGQGFGLSNGGNLISLLSGLLGNSKMGSKPMMGSQSLGYRLSNSLFG